jgi:hypothetical protein
MVSVLTIGPKVHGSNPAEEDGILMTIDISSTTSFRWKIKPSVPCPDFYGMYRTLQV